MRHPLTPANASRDPLRTKDSWGKNCFLEQRQGGQVVGTMRGGTLIKVATPASTGQGTFNYTSLPFQIVSDVLYKYSAAFAQTASYNLVPTVANLQFQFGLIDVASGSTGFVFKSTADFYYFNGTTVTHVTDPDYPATTVYGVVFLDGTYYVMDASARIWGSAINDPSSWSALNVIEAQIEPDGGVAIARQLNYIVAFGTSTTEFFYDAGNPTGSPLLPYTSAMLKIGCATAGSIAQTVNTLFFMGVAQQKGRGIYKLEGTQPTYISNAVIDRILNADDLATVYSFCIRISGHNFYVLTLSTSNITLAYDDMTGDWKEWTSLTAGTVLSSVTLAYADQTVTATKAAHGLSDGSIVTIAGASPVAYNGTFVVNYIDSSHFSYVPASTPASTPATGTITATPYTEGKFIGRNYTGFGVWDLVQDTSGNLYSVSTDSTTDNGLPISVLIRTKLLDGQNNKFKYFTQAQIIGDRVSEVASVRYTNDDYQTWSAYRQVDLSLARPQVYRLGRARRRAFEVKYIGDSAMRFEAIELTAEEGVR